MQKILFKKNKQKQYFKLVIKNLNSTSLRGLLQFGINTNYSALKNYNSQRRLIPRDLFEDLNHLAKINPKKLNIIYLKENWGKVKGGKISKRKK